MSRQQGAAALALIVVVATIAAVALVAALPLGGVARERATQQALADAASALAGFARMRRCIIGTGTVASHLPCPDHGTAEGVAATSCAPIAVGRLPWRTLGIEPLRDASGECLWYERTATGARVIAPGAALPGQSRTAAPVAPICGGHYGQTDYLEAAGNDRSLDVPPAALSVPAGC
ncbi:MAG: hypothetical protein RMK97_04620 [Sutterellaceae bacterium]|nr:hypothetical protein [Burkholderiaceae bacterium]MCX7900732.1 hypothetical protein [Burkholderiaceae bacterium]MDW8429776.1 hypothetical protein [Sutterellaceae bacterium]